MTEVIEVIASILGADIALLIAFLAYISPKYNQHILERRKTLDENVNAKINEAKTNETTIEAFLPLFEEYEKVERWKKTLRQILEYLGYSTLLVVIGLFFDLFSSVVTVGGIPVEVILVIGGGFVLLFDVYLIVRYACEVNEWKVSTRK